MVAYLDINMNLRFGVVDSRKRIIMKLAFSTFGLFVIVALVFCSTYGNLLQAQGPPLYPDLSGTASVVPAAPLPSVAPLPSTVQAAPAQEQALYNHNQLRIEELEAMAMANNPTIAQAVQQIETLRGRRVQAGLYPNPTIGYQGEEMGDGGTAGQQGIVVGQRIVTGGKLGLSQAVVSREIEQAQHELNMQRWRVSNAVRSRAYDVIITQRAIALGEQLVRIGSENLSATQQLFDAEQISQAQVFQARIEAESANVALNNARNGYQTAWRRLAVMIGAQDLQSTPLADTLDDSPPGIVWEQALSRLYNESPELAKARSGIELARTSLARARAGKREDFDIEAAVRYNNESSYTTASIGVNIPLQIYNRNQGAIRSAQSELAASQQEVHRVELLLEDRLAQAFERYMNGAQQVEQYKNGILADAKSSLELVQLGYEQGEFSYLELLTSQRTYYRVNQMYIESLRNLWMSRIEIDGMLISGGLNAPGT
jgi:outer membrane protein, heavy metal efflux system